MVDLFNISAMSSDGPNEKYKALQASGEVLSVVKLKDWGLAVGTIASTVDLSNIPATPPDGLDEKYKTLQARGKDCSKGEEGRNDEAGRIDEDGRIDEG